MAPILDDELGIVQVEELYPVQALIAHRATPEFRRSIKELDDGHAEHSDGLMKRSLMWFRGWPHILLRFAISRAEHF